MDNISSQPVQKIPRLTHWRAVFKFSVGAVLFWLLEFAAQYYWLIPGDLATSFIRSFALTGATLISTALFLSAIFRWFPRTARYWRIRRYFGVSGFVFITFHSQTALYYVFGYDLTQAYSSFNPFVNPVVFGSFAYFILLVMALTSSDWAVAKLTPRVWKFIHRFVYIAYPALIFHFLLINPKSIKTLPGYVLLAITAAALFGQVYWFFTISSRRKFKSLGFFVGIAIILAAVVAAYLAWGVY